MDISYLPIPPSSTMELVAYAPITLRDAKSVPILRPVFCVSPSTVCCRTPANVSLSLTAHLAISIPISHRAVWNARPTVCNVSLPRPA